ncbi:MAG: glycosyltransferase family 4 protein [Pseudomonadota bacterium]
MSEDILSNRQHRIAVLVHNSVLRDARVLKQAKTLSQCGYTVEVHGFSPDADGSVKVIPDTDTPVYLNSLTVVPKIKSGSAPYICSLAGAGPARDARAFTSSKKSRLSLVLRKSLSLSRHLTNKLKSYLRKAPQSRHVLRWRFEQIGGALACSVAQRPAPDIIHIHDTVALTAARKLRKHYPNAQIIWDAHEIYEHLAQASPHLSQLNRSIICEAGPYIDRFITISDSFAAFYRRCHGATLPIEPVIIRNATDKTAVPPDDGRLRKAAGLPDHQRIALYQGGYATHRGLEDLVAASRYLNPDWTIVLMGWGSIEDTLRKIAAQAALDMPKRLSPAVCFLPGVPHAELSAWTVGATIGVIPYEDTGLNHRYCTPNKLWEYPNAGLPILASDLVEIRKIVDDWNVGWCLPKSPTPETIAATINGLSDGQIAESRRACRSFIEADNWSVYEKRLVALYRDLARAKTVAYSGSLTNDRLRALQTAASVS